MILAFTWFLFKEPWFSKSDGFTLLSSSSNFCFPCPQPLLPYPTPSFPHILSPSFTSSWCTHICNYALLCRCWKTGFDIGIASSISSPPYSLRHTLNMKHVVLPWLAVQQISGIYLSLPPRYVLPHWPFMWVYKSKSYTCLHSRNFPHWAISAILVMTFKVWSCVNAFQFRKPSPV